MRRFVCEKCGRVEYQPLADAVWCPCTRTRTFLGLWMEQAKPA